MLTKSLLALFTAASLTACSAAEQQPYDDFLGNVYPAKCRGDLSYVTAPITFMSPDQMAALSRLAPHMKMGDRLYGITMSHRFIYVDNTLMGWKRDDIIRHERCHVIAGDWHK